MSAKGIKQEKNNKNNKYNHLILKMMYRYDELLWMLIILYSFQSLKVIQKKQLIKLFLNQNGH